MAKKQINNQCWKCQHKYKSDGWYNWFMGVCPKCGANNTGHYLIVGVIAMVLCIYAFMPDKKPTETIKSAPVEQTADADMPDYVQNGKLVWEIPVCRMADDYSEYLHAVVNKDYETTRIYEKKHLCFMLKSGVKISVLDWNLIKPTKIRAYKDGDMLDLYTSAQFVKGAD